MTDGPANPLLGRARRAAGRVRRGLRERRTTRAETQARERRDRLGRPPAVEVEQTWLGPAYDDAVARFTAEQRGGVDPDYDLVAEHLDVRHVLLERPGYLDGESTDLVADFLDRGAGKGPSSPAPDFSLREYLRRYPQRRQGLTGAPYVGWLREHRAAGEIGDPAPGIRRLAPLLGLGEQEIAEAVGARRADLRQRMLHGVLGEQIAKAAEIEPLISQTWTEVAAPKMVPFSQDDAVSQAAAMYAAQQAADWRRARLVIVVNRARWGGGRRLEGHLAHALVRDRLTADDIVVLYTDDGPSSAPPGRFPDGVREVDLATIVRQAGVPAQAAERVLVHLLRSLHADAIVNVNSRLLYQTLRSYGRALAATERIFLCYFCNEQVATGAWFGWSLGQFYRSTEQVAGVITDSHALADELVERFTVPPSVASRLHVFSAPVDGTLPVVEQAPANARPQVFWAGRWDRQKRLDLVAEVARSMPDVDLRMWGEPKMGGSVPELPANVVIEGRYERFTDLPLADADAWLYTSAWDGVPSQLLEVSMTGIPIVGSLVGGTGEILAPDGAWPVAADAPAAAYVEALRAVLADPAAARAKALSLRERLLAQRTEERYAELAADVLLRPSEAAS